MDNAAVQQTDLRQTHNDNLIGLPVSPKPGQLYVLRRDNKTLVPFNPTKIKNAITKAYLVVEGDNAAASSRVHEVVDELTHLVGNTISH